MKNWLQSKIAFLYGKYFSLDRKFRKQKAAATITFGDDDKLGGSIRVTLGGIDYYFEGRAEIETFTNNLGQERTRKRLKYGGWGISLAAPENKLF